MLTHSYTFQVLADALDRHVNSAEFDEECAVLSRKIAQGLSSDNSDLDHSFDYSSLWEKEEDSSISSARSHNVSKLEAYLYYFGIRGTRHMGPKLIFRTSKDVFTAPLGPEHDPRVMQLLPVYGHPILGEGDLWDTICSKVVQLLDEREIRHSSVDLVRFSWVEKKEDGKGKGVDNRKGKGVEGSKRKGVVDGKGKGVEDGKGKSVEDSKSINDKGNGVEDGEGKDVKDGEGKDVKDGKGKDVEDGKDAEDPEDVDIDTKVTPYEPAVITPVTIWVGVLPDTLTGEVAFHSSKDILDLLAKHGISDVDVAYRESVVRDLSGPKLFAPVSDVDPLKLLIDPVTTALGLPIAGLKTLHNEGTMGFYFKVGEDLYAVTARHILFPEHDGNNQYNYIGMFFPQEDECDFDFCYKAGPKKEVVLMGTATFHRLLESLQDRIGNLNTSVDVLKKQIVTYTTRSQDGGPAPAKAAQDLTMFQAQLTNSQTAIVALKRFFLEMKKNWSKPEERVIGHVTWAPPITFIGHTQDVCVIKLDKPKFWDNFKGNAIDLGMC